MGIKKFCSVLLLLSCTSAGQDITAPSTRPKVFAPDKSLKEMAEASKSTGQAPPPFTDRRLTHEDREQVVLIVKETLELYKKGKYQEYVKIREQRKLPTFLNLTDEAKFDATVIAQDAIKLKVDSAIILPIVRSKELCPGWMPISGRTWTNDVRGDMPSVLAIVQPEIGNSCMILIPAEFDNGMFNNIGEDPTYLVFAATKGEKDQMWKIVLTTFYCNNKVRLAKEGVQMFPPVHAYFQ